MFFDKMIMDRIRGKIMRMIKVNYRNKDTKDFLEESTLLEISDSFKKYYNYPILVAKVDNDITPLAEKVTKSCDIDFYDRSSDVGNEIYGRSLQFVLILAVRRVLGREADIVVEHSIDKGIYCEIHGASIDKPTIRRLSTEMKNIVEENLIFTKVSVSRIDAIKYFKSKNKMDKVNVLKYISNTYINLYRLDDLYDYFYGDLAYSTKALDDFKLTYIKGNGFVLSYPDVYNPECTLDYKHHPKLFDAFLDYTVWGRKLGINNAADLNERVSTGLYGDLIRVAEAYYDGQLSNIAEEIYHKKENIRIILLAGPSSSGKTTTSKKLQIYLQSKGIRTHQISIDDYYVDRDKTPLDKDGNPDFESIHAIDLELFNKHLIRLLNKEKVLLPEFNFITGKREFKKKWLQLGGDDMIVIEGLHALNDKLTMSIERKHKYHIYMSPLTQLNIDNHNRIHTSDTRKLRRIIRDNKCRGYSAADTLSMWPKIRAGEEKNIFPYQEDVDKIINSALIYELGVLKTYAEPLLFSVRENDPVYPEALRLINFLRNFLPIPSEEVPKDSVLREFIGNSCFSGNNHLL